MRKQRIIPIVLFRQGHVVQSKEFKHYKNLGNPLLTINRLSEWGADEICFLDISGGSKWDSGRSDLKEQVPTTFLEVLREVSKVAYMPLTCGGGVRTLFDVEKRVQLGADKVSFNSAIQHHPSLLLESAKEFGSQCVVASIDVKFESGDYMTYVDGGMNPTGSNLKSWINRVEDLGAGEILLNSIDNDGAKKGYDLNMLKLASLHTKIPIIACGGVGLWEHFAQALRETDVDAVSAANIFQHQEQSVYKAHQTLFEIGLNVRRPRLQETDYSKGS